MRSPVIALVLLSSAVLLRPAPASAANPPFELLEVVDDRALSYHDPSLDSPVIRRLYLGELVQPVERTIDPRGNPWIKVQLGATSFGYVPESKVAKAGPLPQARWQPRYVVRDERPIGVGVRVLGETLGATVSLRYLPLTRLGLTFGYGSVFELDNMSMRGHSASLGIISHPFLSRVSPFLEAGLTSLTYGDGNSKLHVLATYLTVGFEVMFQWGGYASLGASFVRSLDVEIGYSWNSAHIGATAPGSFGRMGRMMDGDTLQTIQPSLTVGYGF